KDIMIIFAMIVGQAQAAESHPTLSTPDEKIPFSCIVQMYNETFVLEGRAINSVKILMQENPMFAIHFSQLISEALGEMHQKNSDTLRTLQGKLLDIKRLLSNRKGLCWARYPRAGHVLDEIVQKSLPDLQKKQSDFVTIFRELHQVGELAVNIFRFLELCTDQSFCGQEFAVSQERMRVDSEQEAWEIFDQISQDLRGLLDNQKQELGYLRRLCYKRDGFPTVLSPVLLGLVDRSDGLCLFYKAYRTIILKEFCTAIEYFNQIRGITFHIRQVVQIHDEMCALENRAIKSMNLFRQDGSLFEINARNLDELLEKPEMIRLPLQDNVKILHTFLRDNDMLLGLGDQELMDMVLKGSAPNLHEKHSDFMDVCRVLHQAGDIVMAVFRCVDFRIDPNDGGKKVVVSREDICVESREQAWENLDQIPKKLDSLTKSQHSHLAAIKMLIANQVSNKHYGLRLFLTDRFLRYVSLNPANYELYGCYRRMIMRAVFQACECLQYFQFHYDES
ncbi:MAG: hypothetical protein OXC30_06195, partial [Alphaproteobacteria bacterium]|nr:hypothetical protein [Alphaproteobacteria bacterium]